MRTVLDVAIRGRGNYSLLSAMSSIGVLGLMEIRVDSINDRLFMPGILGWHGVERAVAHP